MNKVFKVIWSEARNAYVVVSEIAKNHGSKSCSTKKLLTMLIATGVMTCASMAPAMAADPPAEALKHSTVAAGYNITVTPKDNSDGGKEYNVDLRNDIYLAGNDPNALVSISGSKGTIWATGSVTVGSGVDGSVVMDATTATVSGLGNKTTAYAGFANGKGKAATEEQLKEISEVAENANQGWNLSTNGGEASKVAPGETVDFSGDQNINISNDGTNVKVDLKNDIYLAGDDPNAFVNISGSKGTIWASGSVAAGNVVMDGATATVSGLGNTTTAYAGFANGKGKAATEEQLKEISEVAENANQGWNLSTNGGEASKVAPGETVDFSGDQNINISNDGTNVKVDLKNDIYLAGDDPNAFVNISGSKGTIWASGSVAAGNVVMDGATATVSGLGNTTTAYDGFANGKGKAATEEQLKEVATEAGKHTTLVAGDNVQVKEEKTDNGLKYTVSATDTTYTAGNGIAINGENNAISVKLKAGEGNLVVDKDGLALNKDLQDIASISNGSVKLALDSATETAGLINGKGASVFLMNDSTVINGAVGIDKNGKISGVAAGKISADSTDAVNGSQLHAVATEAGKHSKVVNGSNINVEETDVDGQKIYKVNLNKDIMLGDLTGKYVNISGTNGTIETTGYIATKDRVYADKGAKLADIDVTGNKISNGASSIVLDGSNVKVNDKVTIDQNGKISGVAAGEISKTSTDAINGSQLNQTNENVAQNKADIAQNKADIAQNKADIAQNKADIAQNKADIAANRADIDKNKADIAQNKADIKNLDNRVTNVEELAKKHTTVTAGDNITVTEDTNKDGGKEYKVALDKDIKLDSVTTGQTVMNNDGLKVGDKVSVTKDAVTAGKTSISDEGVKVNGKTYVSDNGLNANDQKVTNVADGDISATSKDAVNGSQLYKTNQEVANNTNRINKLGSRVNKVGAGAAALAALHPMDFDPDDKLTFSAGYGNYAGENAAAIGAYYRPDEKVMFSVAGTVGNGENMVNAGVSFALDRTNHVSNSRTALAREVIDLRGQLAVMGAKMAKMEKAFGMLDETKTKLFPDIPANHWAYEYIAKLAGNGYIEGYPDGNFGGDRLMTRYEFAAMLYRAIENGAALEEKIIKEFEPELGRIRVDRISGEDGDRDKIERVRVNDTKGERDHYGNKLAK